MGAANQVDCSLLLRGAPDSSQNFDFAVDAAVTGEVGEEPAVDALVDDGGDCIEHVAGSHGPGLIARNTPREGAGTIAVC